MDSDKTRLVLLGWPDDVRLFAGGDEIDGALLG